MLCWVPSPNAGSSTGDQAGPSGSRSGGQAGPSSRRSIASIRPPPHMYQCDDCHVKTRDRHDLKNHKDAVHFKLKKFICKACGKSSGKTGL